MIKYRVHVGFYDYDFDDAGEAVDFCLTAKKHYAEDDKPKVSIDFIEVGEPELIFAEVDSEDE